MRSLHDPQNCAFTDERCVEGSMLVEHYIELRQPLGAIAGRIWNGASAVAVLEVQ